MIDSLIIQKIKDASNVVDVIGDFYDLKKKGQTYMCLCPFHDDEHIGSFQISEHKNIYKCFSCDAQGHSIEFLMQHEGLSFTDAIRWLGKKYCIDIPGEEEFKREVKKAEARKPQPKVPMLTLDVERYVKPMLKAREDSQLVKWIRSLHWNDEQKARIGSTLQNYQVGYSKKLGGVIFYQIDDKGQCRSGKVMQYKSDGHRDKTRNPQWVHSMLYKGGWLDYDKSEFVSTLFGMHLINFTTKQVSIVESEKSALICSIFYDGIPSTNVWLATGGKSALKREKLQPIIDKGLQIVLYPDMDGIEEWKQKAKEIDYKHLTVAEDWMKKYWRPEDGEKADIADILVRMITPTIDKVIEKYPALKPLNDKFGLELVNVNKI